MVQVLTEDACQGWVRTMELTSYKPELAPEPLQPTQRVTESVAPVAPVASQPDAGIYPMYMDTSSGYVGGGGGFFASIGDFLGGFFESVGDLLGDIGDSLGDIDFGDFGGGFD